MTRKTAVSLPDDVFEDADRLAAELKLTRSEVYARALREYIEKRFADDPVTRALDRSYGPNGELDDEERSWVEASHQDGREAIERGDWTW